ncbi:hypothetical protein BH09VER1_BH09VER1_52120 [soil metagenome]
MRGRKPGTWVKNLEKWLQSRRKAAPSSEPIPASRELAGIFEVNHTSIFRQLQRLEKSGLLWRAENGRFHFAEARLLVEKPRPVACLFRKIENWSALYQELMEGISQVCEQQGIGSLLWHEEALVRHAGPDQPPTFAQTRQQIQSLSRFVEKYGVGVGGVILDHVWSDEAIARLPQNVRKNAILLCRSSASDVRAVAPDFNAAANLAVTHLSAMGYQRIIAVRPFAGDPSIESCLASLKFADITAGLPSPSLIASPREKAQFIRTLGKSSLRTGLLFPEDNTAVLFWRECLAAGLKCPETIGIVSLQGTRAARQGNLSHTRTNYHQLGQTAVALALDLPSPTAINSPVFVQGDSTCPLPRN